MAHTHALTVTHHYPMRRTQHADLFYQQLAPGCWRYVDATTLSHIGPHYRSRAELFADMDRFARIFGC